MDGQRCHYCCENRFTFTIILVIIFIGRSLGGSKAIRGFKGLNGLLLFWKALFLVPVGADACF